MQIACSAKLAVSVKIKGIVQTVPPTQHSHHNQSIKKQITSHSNPNFGIFILIPPLHAPCDGYLRLPYRKRVPLTIPCPPDEEWQDTCPEVDKNHAPKDTALRIFASAVPAGRAAGSKLRRQGRRYRRGLRSIRPRDRGTDASEFLPGR